MGATFYSHKSISNSSSWMRAGRGKWEKGHQPCHSHMIILGEG